MSLWKLLYSNGSNLGICVVRAETEKQAREMALEFARREGLMTDWLPVADAAKCSEEPGVIAWGEA